jgi:hypothetical protein
VTQLEVTPQNVKQPKNGRNSGHVRNSGDYGTTLMQIQSGRTVPLSWLVKSGILNA